MVIHGLSASSASGAFLAAYFISDGVACVGSMRHYEGDACLFIVSRREIASARRCLIMGIDADIDAPAGAHLLG